jgi:hypothetical protein
MMDWEFCEFMAKLEDVEEASCYQIDMELAELGWGAADSGDWSIDFGKIKAPSLVQKARSQMLFAQACSSMALKR